MPLCGSHQKEREGMNYLPGGIFLLSVIEILCYSVYCSFLPHRFAGARFIGYQIISIVLLYFINSVFYEHLGYPTALLYFSYIFLWILVGYRIPIRATVFHLLIFFMSGHCLKQIFGNIIWASFWREIPEIIGNPTVELFSQMVVWTVFGLIYVFFLVNIRKQVQNMDPRHLTWNRIALMIPAIIPVLYISYLTITLDRDPTVTELMIEAVSSFCGLLLIINQERAHLASIYRVEIAELENSMHSQYERYLVSTEAAEQINQACHDIKNQLLAFRGKESSPEQEGYFRELEITINKYKAVYHTGNGVLDGLLYEKGKRAQETGTQLLCFADGTLLVQMSPVDLCTLVGNLLDNALEACAKTENAADRSVLLKVTEFREYVLLRCENSNAEQLMHVGQEFLSTKMDGNQHGYGLKGIRHVVEEYGGDMTIDSESGRFVVSILLPLARN